MRKKYEKMTGRQLAQLKGHHEFYLQYPKKSTDVVQLRKELALIKKAYEKNKYKGRTGQSQLAFEKQNKKRKLRGMS